MTKQSGFSTLGMLVGVLVVVAVGAIGVVVYQHNGNIGKQAADTNSSQTTNQQKSTVDTQPPDKYPGWGSAELKEEKLGFRYPSDWAATLIKNGENVAVKSPTIHGHYMVVVLQAGPGDTNLNLNMLGSVDGATIEKRNVSGSQQPL